MRVNLAMSHGVEAAGQFGEACRSIVGSGYATDPYWDLRIVVDFLPELSPESRPEFDRLDDFVARSVAELG